MLEQQQGKFHKFSAMLRAEMEERYKKKKNPKEERSNTHSSSDIVHGPAIVPELMGAPLLIIL